MTEVEAQKLVEFVWTVTGLVAFVIVGCAALSVGFERRIERKK